MGRIAQDPYERIGAYIKKGAPDECWLWQGKSWYTHPTTKERTYGQTTLYGKRMGAHRACWILANKRDIPDGMLVLHECDNPACVNPAHLKLGTGSENMREMVDKGRANRAYGERASKSKLTADQVREILALEGIATPREIGERYGVHANSITMIFKGKNWKHIPRY